MKPAIHGRDHRQGGSDPIPGIGDGIRFNVDNEGGYLLVVANDHIPADDSSIRIQALEDGLGDGGDFEILAENILFLQGNGEVEITSTAGPVVITSFTDPLTIVVNGATFLIHDDTIELPSGAIIGP